MGSTWNGVYSDFEEEIRGESLEARADIMWGDDE